MKIIRYNNSAIKKKKIDLNKLTLYDKEKVKYAINLLEQEIDNSFVSHFNYISYALKEDNNTSSHIKNSGCISDCKRLKAKLKQIGLETYYVSCKAKGFSNPAGDALVKEAHIFLVYPAIKNKKVYFTIFDPGFRMYNIIQFYDKEDSSEVSYVKEGIALY